MIEGLNHIESLDLKVVDRDMSRSRHRGGRGAFDLETEPRFSAHEQQVELGTGMGGPEKAFVGFDAQPPDELVDDEAFQKDAPDFGWASRSAVVRRSSSV